MRVFFFVWQYKQNRSNIAIACILTLFAKRENIFESSGRESVLLFFDFLFLDDISDIGLIWQFLLIVKNLVWFFSKLIVTFFVEFFRLGIGLILLRLGRRWKQFERLGRGTEENEEVFLRMLRRGVWGFWCRTAKSPSFWFIAMVVYVELWHRKCITYIKEKCVQWLKYRVSQKIRTHFTKVSIKCHFFQNFVKLWT